MRPRGENVEYDKLRDRFEAVIAQRDALGAQVDTQQARIRELEVLLSSAHAELTNAGHQELRECECQIAAALETKDEHVVMKCPDCGVHYVKGAAHFSACPSQPGASTENRGGVK